MGEFFVSKSFGWDGGISEKAASVMRMFGLTVDRLKEMRSEHCCRIKVEAGDVVFITGPSGAGKSVILREIEKAVPAKERINLDQIKLSGEESVVDRIEGDCLESLRVLSVAGLSDVFSVLKRPANLSEGEQYRFRLAAAMARDKKFIFADEFCSNLDRITASVISYNIHKFAKRHGVTFFLAASGQDFLSDLEADVIVNKELCGAAEVIYKEGESES